MRLLSTMVLEQEGQKRTLKAGEVELALGKKMVGLLMKFSIPVALGGGSDLALSEAQRKLLFDCFKFTVKYGDKKEYDPFVAVGGERLHREAKFAFASELEGFDDSTTGLAKVITHGTTATLVVYKILPLGRMWHFDRELNAVLGMGRTQAKTLEVEVTRNDDTIAGDFTIKSDESVSIEFYPIEDDCKGDHWGYVPYWREDSITTIKAVMDDGLPLRFVERSAAHAATDLTEITVKVDDAVVVEKMNPADAIIPYLDKPNVPAAASLLGDETILYQIMPDQPARTMLTGRPSLYQDTKDLDSAEVGLLYVPIPDAEKFKKQLRWASGPNGRDKEIKAVGQGAFIGAKGLPARLQNFLGAVLLDREDRESEALPGLRTVPGHDPVLHIPDSVIAEGKARTSLHGAAEPMSAENIAKSVAATVPANVPSGRGFEKGVSGILQRFVSIFK